MQVYYLVSNFNYYYFKVIFILWLFFIFINCFFSRRLPLCNYYLDIIVTIFHPQVQPNMSQVFFSYLHNSALSLFRNDRLMFDEREFIKLPKKILMEKSTLCFHIPKRFWSILLEHFIKHKPVNLSEGCSILSTKKNSK